MRLKIVYLLLLTMMCCGFSGCDKINNESLKGYSVRIDLGEYGKWNTYGVHALGEYRFFNRAKGIPSNFPYNVNTYTGFGGVLLFMGQDMNGGPVPLAFDMACPVEHNADVTVTIDESNLEAYCPKCKSRYNVLLGSGGPISGMAMDRKVGLNMYKVRATINGGYVITNY
ncbi:MAG: hypothetical protein IK100_11400 [Muribaculaceae bacterium]|nr:hypothetical protein [Muribaculaceae bacterium]MBR5639347.1 hypothetical protein [Muribaculaceae bacterium]